MRKVPLSDQVNVIFTALNAMRTKVDKTKIAQMALAAYSLAQAGMRPDLAWTDSIRELYPADKAKSQLQTYLSEVGI